MNTYLDSVSSNLDLISCLFAGIVLVISSFTFIYTNFYVGNRKIFSLLVFSFVCSMIMLIVFTDLWIFIWGWDFLGIVSYILVINYQNQRSSNAGMITVLSNRVGDRFLFLSLSIIIIRGSWNIIQINKYLFDFFLIFLILTSITKRAQLPFCAWLPAAMAAPTPVSALVHSSTLVTAGVYMIIRFNQNNPSFSLLLLGLMTSILSGVNACNGFDFKKLIALSTLSQIGLMFIALGLGLLKLAFIHLITHGLIKALLFLSAGVVIHQTRSNQDLRIISGLSQNFPITLVCIIITSLVLSGLPFGICFFSKETILNQNFLKRLWILFAIYLAATLTINYSLRLIKNLSYPPSFNNYRSFTENSLNTFWPLINLLLIPFWVRQISLWILLPFTINSNIFAINLSTVVWLLILISFFIGLEVSRNKVWGKVVLNRLVSNLLFLPLISSNIMNKFLVLGFFTVKNVETSWSENLGAQGIYLFFSKIMFRTRFLFVVVWVPVLIIWIRLRI